MGCYQMWADISHLQLQLLQLLRDARFERPPPLTVRVNDARPMLAVQLTALAACLTCSADTILVPKLCGGQQQPQNLADFPRCRGQGLFQRPGWHALQAALP